MSQRDRALCASTIDSDIITKLKEMQEHLFKTSNQQQGKFRMQTLYPDQYPKQMSSQILVKEKGQKEVSLLGSSQLKQGAYNLVLANSHAHKSPPDTLMSELELMENCVITDSAYIHDTLLVKENLIKDPESFY